MTDNSHKTNPPPRQRRMLLVVICVAMVTHGVDRLWLLSPTLQLSSLRVPVIQFQTGTASNATSSPSNHSTSAPTNHPNPTVNTSSNSTGGIFYCGYEVPQLGRSVFPDHAQRYQGGYDKNSHNNIHAGHPRRSPRADDILIYGLHGPCTVPMERFPGKVLVANGEPDGGDLTQRVTLQGRPTGQDIYQIGSVPNGPNTMLAYFVVWGAFLFNYGNGDTGILPKLIQHSLKPINTGKYNAMIYANRACHKHREEAVNEISAIIPIHVGGNCKGARPAKGTFVGMPSSRDGWSRNFEIQKDYKFCFAMENTYPYQPHYITEKILNPFLAGCIPVYYGTPEVFSIFNRHAMVYYDPADPAPALQQIRELHHNETLYNEMLHNQPILAHGNETLRDHFSLLDEIAGGFLKQQIRTMMGL